MSFLGDYSKIDIYSVGIAFLDYFNSFFTKSLFRDIIERMIDPNVTHRIYAKEAYQMWYNKCIELEYTIPSHLLPII